jgi:hypothetical protein
MGNISKLTKLAGQICHARHMDRFFACPTEETFPHGGSSCSCFTLRLSIINKFWEEIMVLTFLQMLHSARGALKEL